MVRLTWQPCLMHLHHQPRRQASLLKAHGGPVGKQVGVRRRELGSPWKTTRLEEAGGTSGGAGAAGGRQLRGAFTLGGSSWPDAGGEEGWAQEVGTCGLACAGAGGRENGIPTGRRGKTLIGEQGARDTMGPAHVREIKRNEI
jgi:hypothetical protein